MGSPSSLSAAAGRTAVEVTTAAAARSCLAEGAISPFVELTGEGPLVAGAPRRGLVGKGAEGRGAVVAG